MVAARAASMGTDGSGTTGTTADWLKNGEKPGSDTVLSPNCKRTVSVGYSRFLVAGLGQNRKSF